MNRGTSEGTVEEISLVKLLNKNRQHSIWAALGISTSKKLYAVHVIRHVHSEFFDRMTKPKADVYIAEGSEISEAILEQLNYVLDEDDLDKYKLVPVSDSGISVKISDSTKFQILKTGPSSFPKLIGDAHLAAGAAVYCLRAEELTKNEAVIKAWGATTTSFIDFFKEDFPTVSKLFDEEADNKSKLKIAASIKAFANNQISNLIINSPTISNYVFTGIGLYPEPYPAHWIYEGAEFRKNRPMNFVVTTGSGRSKGDYTIVIKPR